MITTGPRHARGRRRRSPSRGADRLRRPSRRRRPCRSRAPLRAGSPAPPSQAAPRRRSRRSTRTRPAAPGSPRAAVARRGGRTPSACRRRAARRYPQQRGRPRHSPRAGWCLPLRRRLLRRCLVRGGLLRGSLRRRRLRLDGRLHRRLRHSGGLDCAVLRAPVRTGRTREHVVEPFRRRVFIEVLRVHQLTGEDLLRLDEHLLLARREPLLAVAQRQVPDDFRQFEDVAGLHLVAVVLEAAVPVLGHLRAAARECFDDDLDHVLADDLPEPDLLGVLGGDVDRHVVVQDLDRQILALLAEHLALFLLYDRACPVVWIHHLVADFVQARPFPSYVTATPAGGTAGGVTTCQQNPLETAMFPVTSLLTAPFRLA